MALARRVEGLLWTITALCVVYCLFLLMEARAYRTSPPAPPSAVGADLPGGAVLGRLEIPAIGLSVPVLEDDATKSLLRGVGHIRGTAMLGGLGTTGLAGHRDTFLRPLRGVLPQMEIRAITQAGTYHYIVDSTEVVRPEQVSVLDIQSEPKLVLITCYPFQYVGAAPNRFIVHAHLVSASPDPLPPGR